jgi:hypothetical protein
MKVRHTTIALSCLLVVSACDMGGEQDFDWVDSTSQTVSSHNRLSLNRLSLNGLTHSVLADNPLSDGTFADGVLSYNIASGLESTPEGRDFLEYVVRCALAPEDVLVVEHEGIVYEYTGLLNLAPEWKFEQLSAAKKGYISACLITHVNAFGVSVPISVRSYGMLLADTEERAAYSVYEGTFFGTVFGQEVKTYACSGDSADVALAQSSWRSLRVCTDPSDECGVVSVGRCQDVCEEYHPDYGWTGCWAEGQFFAETLSSFLFADGGYGE